MPGKSASSHGDRAPKHNTFSLFITRASPDTIEGLFTELRDQAFKMGIVDREASVKVSVWTALS